MYHFEQQILEFGYTPNREFMDCNLLAQSREFTPNLELNKNMRTIFISPKQNSALHLQDRFFYDSDLYKNNDDALSTRNNSDIKEQQFSTLPNLSSSPIPHIGPILNEESSKNTGKNNKTVLFSLNSLAGGPKILSAERTKDHNIPIIYSDHIPDSINIRKLFKDFDLNDMSDTPTKCQCSKSECLKFYCMCFKKGHPCNNECSCRCCFNIAGHPKREQAVNALLNKTTFSKDSGLLAQDKNGNWYHTIGCNCQKSNCQKKYCVCFESGVSCSKICKCKSCSNSDCSSCVKIEKDLKNGNLIEKKNNLNKKKNLKKRKIKDKNNELSSYNLMSFEADDEIYTEPPEKQTPQRSNHIIDSNNSQHVLKEKFAHLNSYHYHPLVNHIKIESNYPVPLTERPVSSNFKNRNFIANPNKNLIPPIQTLKHFTDKKVKMETNQYCQAVKRAQRKNLLLLSKKRKNKRKQKNSISQKYSK